MSAAYWEDRYASGGSSGEGSRGKSATFKATFLNEFVADRDVRTVVEFGCGDGEQLALAKYPDYMGIDVSQEAVWICQHRFKNDPYKTFWLLDSCPRVRAELALSLDVIYHLVEGGVYDEHLRDVFGASSRFVILYTTDTSRVSNRGTADHVLHRPVVNDVNVRFPEWLLIEAMAGMDGCWFYVYEKTS